MFVGQFIDIPAIGDALERITTSHVVGARAGSAILTNGRALSTSTIDVNIDLTSHPAQQ
jgi:hypothetical protein